MSIRIGHLFPSWLTLYGDNGNVKALAFYLENEGCECTVDKIEDLKGVDLVGYDLLYMGSGRECGLEFAAGQFAEHKDEILKFVESGKTLLITGNAVMAGAELGLYELFTGKEKDDFFVSDVSATSGLFDGGIRGFQNTRYLIKENDSPVFELISGHGNSSGKQEGFCYKDLIATSIIGPLAAINENFRNMILARLISR